MNINDSIKKAVEAHRQGNLHQAEIQYRSILKLDPFHADANHNLGVIALTGNIFNQAEKLFKIAKGLNPKNLLYRINFIEALIRNSKYEEAKNELIKARVDLGQKKEFEKIEDKLNSDAQKTGASEKRQMPKKRKNPKVPPQQKLNNLLESYNSGALIAAEIAAETLTKEYPSHSFGWKALGAILQLTGRNEEALIVKQIAVRLEPLDTEALNNLANTFIEVGKFKDAEVTLKKAISLDPNFADAHNSYGVVSKKLGNSDKAEKSFRHALQLNANDAQAKVNLANLMVENSSFKEAEEIFTNLITISPNSFEIYLGLGNLNMKKEAFEEAEKNFLRCKELNPNSSNVYFSLSDVALRLGKKGEHENYLKKYLVFNPDDVAVNYKLGVSLLERGMFLDAQGYFEHSLRINPNFNDARNQLGIIAKNLGKIEDAINYFEKALEDDPNYHHALINLNWARKTAVPEWHLPMMNDSLRNDAYFKAIKMAVKKDSLVLDIGTGSGLLSLMAASSGAEKVISCEGSKIISDVAKEIIKSNGYEHKITVFNKHSKNLKIGNELDEKVDLIISEVLSAEFVGEGVRSTTLDAKKRLLKENGIMIPNAGKIRVSLLGNNPDIYSECHVSNVNGFDLSKFNKITLNKFNLRLTEKPRYISDTLDAFEIDISNENEIFTETKILKLKANDTGICIGLIQWLSVSLFEDIEYENIPGETNSHWPTPIYLFKEPIQLTKGEEVVVKAVLDEDKVWF
ncbi:tetratricopeptide repeat protein, partial [Alphaproteobacteria bacterium]|nr:tetratricopeptide repeat protein [Alphaproteobacteria bacterium]